MRADGVLGDEEALRDLVGAVVLVEQQQHLDLAGGENRGDAIGHARAATTGRTWSSSLRATGPERAASPWTTPSRNSAIRSGDSVLSR